MFFSTLRAFLCFLASLSTFSSFSSMAILSLTRLLSISSFISPGPLPPIPPMRRDMAVPFPASLGSLYLSWASSTCTLPSLLCARRAKMSRMSCDLSITFSSVSSLSALLCEGVRSWSNIRRLAPRFIAVMISSRILPSPIRYFGFISFGLWITVSSTETSLDSASSRSSSTESSCSCLGFNETLTSTAFSLPCPAGPVLRKAAPMRSRSR